METGCTAQDKRNGTWQPCTIRGKHRGACQDDECTGCLPQLATHGRLCERHYDKLAESLRALPQLFDDLGEWLKPGEGEYNGQARVSGTPDRRSPLNATIADHREHITRTLRGWIMAEFQATTASIDTTMYASAPAIRLGNLSTKALCHWLTVRLETIATRDFAGDATTEILAADRRAYGLTHPTGRRKVGAAACPEPGCDGTVEGIVEPSALLELPALITCTRNPEHTWRPSEFVAAGERIRKQAA